MKGGDFMSHMKFIEADRYIVKDVFNKRVEVRLISETLNEKNISYVTLTLEEAKQMAESINNIIKRYEES